MARDDATIAAVRAWLETTPPESPRRRAPSGRRQAHRYSLLVKVRAWFDARPKRPEWR